MRTIILAFAAAFVFLGWQTAISGSMLTELRPKMIEYGVAHEVTYEECHREAQRIADQYEEKDFELYFHGDGITLFKIISRDGDKYRISCDKELTMRIIKFTGDLFSGL
ncbi:MAG: hypothetical protein OXF24_03540 [Hyphomicrobiales bacterium]|nr:hypothetical protein [Hyphomicrobiales bacterium]MCY4048642.1 hypothetical protein [Hyphomicrobiales bacterium]MCY4052849.1 hypothetical protein [Hyphomicrobiales bacterium]